MSHSGFSQWPSQYPSTPACTAISVGSVSKDVAEPSPEVLELPVSGTRDRSLDLVVKEADAAAEVNEDSTLGRFSSGVMVCRIVSQPVESL